MKKFKSCGVVMLPTEEEAQYGNLVLRKDSNKLIKRDFSYYGKERQEHPYDYIKDSVWYKTQHLYITSDEEIKKGDWFLTDNRNNDIENRGLPKWELKQCTSIFNKWIGANNTEDEGYNPEWSRKILATTDKLINPLDRKLQKDWYLPQISQPFIPHYISEYNKGNKIEKVEVEYQNIRRNSSKSNPLNEVKIIECLLVNLDNTINIKSIEEKLWNREEIKQLFRNFRSDVLPFGQISDYTLNEWLSQNL